MFTKIRYDVTFAPNRQYPAGRTFSRQHDLREGFGAIVGPNEAGKSLILEFARFALFGSKALRGVTADYGNLEVEVEVLGMRIVRTITNAKLWIDGELVAKGTTPVNARIFERLGFGLKVFDVANSINQGEIEALQDMRPTERAKLVGGVVGLDKLDDLVAYANEQALGAERAAKTVEATLIAPVAPAEPECWPNRGMMQDFLKKAEEDQLALAKIDGELSAPHGPPPTKPGDAPTTDTEAELEQFIQNNQKVQALKLELEHLPAVLDIEQAERDWDAYDAYMTAQRFLEANPAPTFTLTDAVETLAAWDLIDEWDHYNRWAQAKSDLEQKIDSADTVDCPGCGRTFPLAADRVAHLQQELEDLGTIAEPAQAAPARPKWYRADAEERIHRDHEVEALLVKRDEANAVPAAPFPGGPRESLPARAAANQRRVELEAEIPTITVMPGAVNILMALREWKGRCERYDADLRAWQEREDHRAELLTKREELVYAPARVAELRPIVAAFAPYEQALARFTEDMTLYELRLEQIAEMRRLSEKWRSAKEALGVLRGLVKQHLYPSLAKAASVLLAGMTGGARRLIEIDEEFNVMVDGQRLDTLSGSGKAVANLAIRLGLGQVLTHRVFPVIFADEIDAAMDDERAASTQDILHQCARRVSQLLLVSHKKPEADWYIDLGEHV